MRTIDKNHLFYQLLHAVHDPSGRRPRWTIEKIAAELYLNRSRLNDVINNKPGHGAHTRPKLVRFFRKNFEQWPAILQALGWDNTGKIVSHGTLQIGNSAQFQGAGNTPDQFDSDQQIRASIQPNRRRILPVSWSDRVDRNDKSVISNPCR